MDINRTIVAYRDRLSARSGDTINFMVSSLDSKPYSAELVRIISGNSANEYSGLELESIAAPFTGQYEGFRQVSDCGSRAIVDVQGNPLKLTSFSLAGAVMPTTRGRGDGTLVATSEDATACALRLFLDTDNHLSFSVINSDRQVQLSISLSKRLLVKNWSVVGVSYDADQQRLVLFQDSIRCLHSVSSSAVSAHCVEEEVSLSSLDVNKLTFAASPNPVPSTVSHFNGRLDSFRLLSRACTTEELIELVKATIAPDDPALEGFWDFSTDMSSDTFSDLSLRLRHGRLVNLPTRAVRGFRWNGQEQCWRHRPDHYSAIHFSEYDVYDCRWQTCFSFLVPEELRSGIYAAKITKGPEVEYAVFFVAPSRGKAHGPVAFLASTATYLAYANDINAILMAPLIGGKDAVLPEEELLVAHPEFGRSLYHKHVDGFGIHFSSYLRPTVNIRPDSRAWSLTADLDIVHWLEKSDIDYEVITDEQLHHEGEELLANFSVLVTGAHPEYYSQAMRDGIDAFTHAGGRLMYMGGNGFYWKVAYSDAWPAAIELRRAEDGTRAWRSQAAEYYQQFDGELGGLWLRQELPPQKLVGVGFAAQGNPGGMRFRKGVAVHDPRIGFAFEGVETDIIADYGKMKASAMGEEVDRVDYSLGTPGHAIVLASSENHHASMLRCKEELFLILPQIVDQDSKADVVFFEVEGGGAVFSTGSIAWSSVLAFNHFDNPSAKLTMNVLRRFMDPALFYPPETENPIETLLPEVYQMPPGLRIDQFSYGRMLWESLRKALMLIALPIMLKAKNIAMPAPAPRRDTVLGDHKRG